MNKEAPLKRIKKPRLSERETEKLIKLIISRQLK
jgi:hypothetical protein